jgi:hypothetical protein
MEFAKKITVALLAGLLGAISVTGCNPEACSDPCELADNCIDVTGTFAVVIQVGTDKCNAFAGGGPSLMEVTATPSDTKTALHISMSAASSLTGELCDTADTAQPRNFGFAVYEKQTVYGIDRSMSVSGNFIDTAAGIQACGSIFYSSGSGEDRCNTHASFYSSTEYCN